MTIYNFLRNLRNYISTFPIQPQRSTMARSDFTIEIRFKALEDLVSYLKSSDQTQINGAAEIIKALTNKLI